jgi:chromosome segregation ATPase
MAISKLQGQTRDRQKELDATLLSVGTKADQDGAAQAIAAEEAAAAAPEARRVQEANAAVDKARPLLQEKTDALNKAQAHLDDEEKKHLGIIASLEEELKARGKEASSRDDVVKTIQRSTTSHESQISAARNQLQKAEQDPESKIDADGVKARIADLEQALQDARAKLGPAQTEAAHAREAVNAKSSEVKTAKANWKTLRAELADIVKAAADEQAQAQQKLRAAEDALRAGRQELGRKLFDTDTAPEGCADLAAQAQTTRNAIEAIGAEIADKQGQVERLSGGTKRFALTAGGCLVVCIIILALIWLIARGCRSDEPEQPQAPPATAAPADPGE